MSTLIEKECTETAPEADEPQRDAVLTPSPAAQAQLSLFQTFYAPEAVRERQSNVIEIWDAAPKYITPRGMPTSSANRPRCWRRPSISAARCFG